MTRSRRVPLIAALFVGVGAATVLAQHLAREDEQWPPAWYVDPADDRDEYVALRRRAIATPSTEFPPNRATLAYLRHMAVGAATESGERIEDARVYPGAGYVLQLRGKFSTAEISPPPSRHRRRTLPPFLPCLTFILDTATITPTATSLGDCEDFSFLGNGLELDLTDEGG